MRKSTSVLFIYFGVILCTLLLRVAFALGLGSSSLMDSGDIWTLIVQVLIFGVMPFTLYFITNKHGKFLDIPVVFEEFGFKKPKGTHLLLTLPITILMMFCSVCIVTIWSIFLSMFGYSRSSTSTDYYNVDAKKNNIIAVVGAVLVSFVVVFIRFYFEILIYI